MKIVLTILKATFLGLVRMALILILIIPACVLSFGGYEGLTKFFDEKLF